MQFSFSVSQLTVIPSCLWGRYDTTQLSGIYRPESKPSFLGGVPAHSTEALVNLLYCGGKATVASGYDPHAVFLIKAGRGPPCAWFPGFEDGTRVDNMRKQRELIHWSAVENSVLNQNCGIVESTMVILRGNFVAVFNAEELRASSDMMHPSWGANADKVRECHSLCVSLSLYLPTFVHLSLIPWFCLGSRPKAWTSRRGYIPWVVVS